MKHYMAAALAATALVALAGTAQAASIVVTPSIAPNAFGSPSYAQYVTNAVGALYAGQSSAGDPSLPSYYSAQSNVTTAQVIVTGFPSWMGQADPGTVFGPAFANELGNRMLFGLSINGNGTQFALANLSFSANSTDPFDGLGFSFSAGSYNYSASYEGVLKGDDGLLGTGDDVFITSGPNTQLVDALYGRGSGNSFAAYCDSCTIAQQQAAIDDVASYPGSDFKFTGTYTLGADTGSGTFNISAVPEPATWAMFLLGFGAIGFAMRRKPASSATAA